MKSFEVCFSHRNPPEWHAHGHTKGKSAIHKKACQTYDAPWVGVWDSAWQTCNSCDADIVNASVATCRVADARQVATWLKIDHGVKLSKQTCHASLEDCCAIRFRHSGSAS